MVDDGDRIYSVRVGPGHRALGQMDGEDIAWFWIGDHSEYDRLLRWLTRALSGNPRTNSGGKTAHKAEIGAPYCAVCGIA